jgi:hypothetical protein
MMLAAAATAAEVLSPSSSAVTGYRQSGTAYQSAKHNLRSRLEACYGLSQGSHIRDPQSVSVDLGGGDHRHRHAYGEVLDRGTKVRPTGRADLLGVSKPAKSVKLDFGQRFPVEETGSGDQRLGEAGAAGLVCPSD